MPGFKLLDCEHSTESVMLSQPQRRNIWGGAAPPPPATPPPQTPRFTRGDRTVVPGEGSTNLHIRLTKPIPRWDVHCGGIDDDRKDATALHITFRPQLSEHRQCGLSICTFHLGFSLVVLIPLLPCKDDLARPSAIEDLVGLHCLIQSESVGDEVG